LDLLARSLTVFFLVVAAQENCASVWLFPCTWQSSNEVLVSTESREFENLHVESQEATESIEVDVMYSQMQEVSQASINLIEVNASSA